MLFIFDTTLRDGEQVPGCQLNTVEKFITDNDIGEFTGFTQRSGFCEYPLYLFNVDKLREQCPDKLEQLRRIERTRIPGIVESLLRRRNRKLRQIADDEFHACIDRYR